MQGLFGAIEGGGSKFLCAVGTGPRELVAEARIDTGTFADTMAGVLAFFAPYRAQLRAVGVCAFGPLELTAGERFGALLETPKPGWSHAPLRATLADALGVPVAIDTDVNGAALAEHAWGSARGADPAVYVTVGTGVGVGVVVAGRPLHGLLHPELGHVRVARASGDAFAGVCPFHGDCVEGMASAPALRARVGAEPHTLDDAHPLWGFAAHYLVGLLHTIVLAYAPERVVLGGGVLERAPMLPALKSGLVRSLAGYVPRAQLGAAGIDAYLVRPAFGERAGLAGAFLLALESAPAY